MWVFFLFWAAGLLFGQNSSYNYIIAGLALLVFSTFFWFAGRDMAGGLFFRIRNDIREGTTVSFGPHRGKILSAGITSILLRNDSGDLLRIPYSKVLNEEVSVLPETNLMSSHSFSVSVRPGDGNEDIFALIRSIIVSSPWVSINTEPLIEQDRNISEEFRVNIRVSLIDNKFLPELIQRFRNRSEFSIISQ